MVAASLTPASGTEGQVVWTSEGWPGLSELRVKPYGYAEFLAMLRSWLFRKLLIMNRFGLNYKRH